MTRPGLPFFFYTINWAFTQLVYTNQALTLFYENRYCTNTCTFVMNFRRKKDYYYYPLVKTFYNYT